MHRIATFFTLIAVVLGLHGAPALGQSAPRVVLFEDPALGADRLHYPLLISGERGYRIRCATQADEEAVIRGLGFATVPSTILTAVDPAIAAAAPGENPLLCPTGPDFAIKIFAAQGPQGLTHYLQFPAGFGAQGFADRLYVPGCLGLVEALGLDLTTAVAADPTPFFPGKIHTIACLAGAPLPFTPNSFTDWCVDQGRSAAETATVMALLDASPGGISALGNPAACAAAESFFRAITTLNLNGKGVQSLAPLATLPHLTSLSLANNAITDISPLSRLTALGFLDLSGNQISNITALLPMSTLTRLTLSRNRISDIRTLAALSLLTSLTLDQNTIGDLAPLQFLQALTQLSLAANGLTGPMLEPLTALGQLTRLNLSDNRIASFEFLGALPSTLNIDLTGNPIAASGGQSFLDLCILNRDAATPFGQTIRILIELHGGGTCMVASNAILASTSLDLSGKIISDIRPLAPLTHLTNLNLSANAITDITALSGLLKLTALDLSDNAITDIRPVAPLLGLTRFTASGNPVELGDFVSACLMRGEPDLLTHDQTIEVDALLAASGQVKCQPAADDLAQRTILTIREVGLTTLDYFKVLRDVQSIDLSGNGLNDVVGLQGLPALTRIVARGNNIASLNSFRPIRGLEQLILDENPLNSLIGIGDLTKLKRVNVSNTNLRSVGLLGDLPLLENASLRNLALGYDSLREYCIVNRFDPIALGDVRPFMAAIESRLVADHVDPADCAAVEGWAGAQRVLSLNKQSILSVDPIIFFSNLEELHLFDNQIADARPIASLRLLTKLNLASNRLDSLPVFASVGMRELYLANNQIVDPSPLAPLSALVRIDLSSNRIPFMTPLVANGAASVIDLRRNMIAQAQLADIPVLAVAYLGENPVCAFPNIFNPSFPFEAVVQACQRVPPLVFLGGNRFTEFLLTQPPEELCVTCPEIRIRPEIHGNFIHN